MQGSRTSATYNCKKTWLYALLSLFIFGAIVAQLHLARQIPDALVEQEVHGWHKHSFTIVDKSGKSDNFADGICHISDGLLCVRQDLEGGAIIAEEVQASQASAYASQAVGLNVRQYSRGVSIVDIDGDGLDDLWIGNGANGKSRSGRPTAWRNVGKGRFEEFNGLIPVGIETLTNWGAVWLDYDNDGDSDIVVVMGGYETTNPCPPMLLKNMLIETGRATLLDDSQNLGGAARPSPWNKSKKMRLAGRDQMLTSPPVPPDSLVNIWWGASAADFDRDGFTDVLVTATNQLGYNGAVEWDEAPLWVPAPDVYANGMRRPWVIFRNNGNGAFIDVTKQVLPWTDTFYGELKNPVWLDVNGDNFPDIFMAGSPPLLFIYEPRSAKFRQAREEVLWQGLHGEVNEEVAASHRERLAFSACSADFNQDGLDDLYLGYWRRHDVVLLGTPTSGLVLGLLVEKNLTGAPTISHRGYHAMHEGLPREEASFLANRKWENSMSVGCGDLDADGYPDVLVGTGTPDWGQYDFAFCNRGNDTQGWKGFERCGRSDPLRFQGDTRTHGFAFGDLDGDMSTEVVVATGGFALADQEMPSTLASLLNSCASCRTSCEAGSSSFGTGVNSEASIVYEKLRIRASQANCTWPLPCPLEKAGANIHCDTRGTLRVYAKPLEHAVDEKKRVARVRLQGQGGIGGSGRDAIGASLMITSGTKWRRHATVHSADGFNSQSSAWIPLALGETGRGELEVVWPSGRRSHERVVAGERRVLFEPSL